VLLQWINLQWQGFKVFNHNQINKYQTNIKLIISYQAELAQLEKLIMCL
jgi:hypothetical protein